MQIASNCDNAKADQPTETGTSQTHCGNSVDIVRAIGRLDINPTAKYVATIMRTTRVTDTKILAEMTGLSVRVIQKSKVDYASASDELGESGEPEFANPANPTNPGSLSPPPRVHARAQIELPSEVNLITGEILSPPTPSVDEARVGEEHAGHGVFVNCETIRHKAFSISLPGIRMGVLAAGLSSEDVKAKCVSHALQWAAEIENGKHPTQVVPAKIANFLSASIMGDINRKAVADVRMSKAAGPAGSKQSLRDVIAAERAARAAGAAA